MACLGRCEAKGAPRPGQSDWPGDALQVVYDQLARFRMSAPFVCVRGWRTLLSSPASDSTQPLWLFAFARALSAEPVQTFSPFAKKFPAGFGAGYFSEM